MRTYAILTLSIIFFSTCAHAAEDEKAYAKAALNGLKINHYAEHISVPFEAYANIDYAKSNTQSILYLKPVVPFHLTTNYDLIIRTIAPIYERTPTLNRLSVINGHYINGWGDVNPTFFVTPAQFNRFLVGFGPTISIPTSTNSQYIGTGKWSVGPELAMYYLSDNWIVGFLTDNLWSIAGDEQRPTVNTFQFQYLVSYVFDEGWYLSTNPSLTANWRAPANQQWIVPFGIGVGRVVKVGSESINLAVYSYYNAIRPAKLGPNWQVQLQIEWLFNAISFMK
jgi:hypothetical protein